MYNVIIYRWRVLRSAPYYGSKVSKIVLIFIFFTQKFAFIQKHSLLVLIALFIDRNAACIHPMNFIFSVNWIVFTNRRPRSTPPQLLTEIFNSFHRVFFINLSINIFLFLLHFNLFELNFSSLLFFLLIFFISTFFVVVSIE